MDCSVSARSGLVDVVIPVFNGALTIERTLRSAVEQNVGLIQRIIVIDDGSTDGSAAVVRALNLPVVEVIQTENQGVAAARNLGIERSTAEWVAFLDADDVWVVGKLKAQLDAAESHQAGFICGAINSMPVMGSSLINAAMLSKGNFVATSTVLVRRDVLMQIQPVFASGMSFAEDYLAWLKCLTVTQGYYLSTTLAAYDLSERPRYKWGQILRNFWRMNRLYAIFLRSESIPFEERVLIKSSLVLGSLRSVLSILKRFARSHLSSKSHE
jgi:glycosyltransferase involved in cell wall biosynthesis